MPCFLQAASTLVWSRKGCTSIWLVTSGSVASLAASSSIAVVKFATPTCFAWPFFLALQSDLMLSASGTFGLFQWISSRSTQGSFSFFSDFLDRLLEIAGRELVPIDLGGDEYVLALEALLGETLVQPLAHPLLVAVALGGVEVAVAELERVLHGIDAHLLFQGHGAEPDGRNTRAVGFNGIHGCLTLSLICCCRCR